MKQVYLLVSDVPFDRMSVGEEIKIDPNLAHVQIVIDWVNRRNPEKLFVTVFTDRDRLIARLA